MLLLAVDTSTPCLSAAVVRATDSGCETVAEWAEVAPNRHCELLSGGVRTVLAAADGEAVGALAVGLGPGPFTGLRVGVVTAAALAHAWGVASYGVCSLDAVARDVGGPCVVVTDARRREVYWRAYGERGEPTGPAAVGRAVEVAEVVAGLGVPVVGPATELWPELAGEPRWPRAGALAELLAPDALAKVPPEGLVPLYLRRPDAAESFVAKSVLS